MNQKQYNMFVDIKLISSQFFSAIVSQSFSYLLNEILPLLQSDSFIQEFLYDNENLPIEREENFDLIKQLYYNIYAEFLSQILNILSCSEVQIPSPFTSISSHTSSISVGPFQLIPPTATYFNEHFDYYKNLYEISHDFIDFHNKKLFYSSSSSFSSFISIDSFETFLKFLINFTTQFKEFSNIFYISSLSSTSLHPFIYITDNFLREFPTVFLDYLQLLGVISHENKKNYLIFNEFIKSSPGSLTSSISSLPILSSLNLNSFFRKLLKIVEEVNWISREIEREKQKRLKLKKLKIKKSHRVIFFSSENNLLREKFDFCSDTSSLPLSSSSSSSSSSSTLPLSSSDEEFTPFISENEKYIESIYSFLIGLTSSSSSTVSSTQESIINYLESSFNAYEISFLLLRAPLVSTLKSKILTFLTNFSFNQENTLKIWNWIEISKIFYPVGLIPELEHEEEEQKGEEKDQDFEDEELELVTDDEDEQNSDNKIKNKKQLSELDIKIIESFLSSNLISTSSSLICQIFETRIEKQNNFLPLTSSLLSLLLSLLSYGIPHDLGKYERLPGIAHIISYLEEEILLNLVSSCDLRKLSHSTFSPSSPYIYLVFNHSIEILSLILEQYPLELFSNYIIKKKKIEDGREDEEKESEEDQTEGEDEELSRLKLDFSEDILAEYPILYTSMEEEHEEKKVFLIETKPVKSPGYYLISQLLSSSKLSDILIELFYTFDRKFLEESLKIFQGEEFEESDEKNKIEYDLKNNIKQKLRKYSVSSINYYYIERLISNLLVLLLRISSKSSLFYSLLFSYSNSLSPSPILNKFYYNFSSISNSGPCIFTTYYLDKKNNSYQILPYKATNLINLWLSKFYNASKKLTYSYLEKNETSLILPHSITSPLNFEEKKSLAFFTYISNLLSYKWKSSTLTTSTPSVLLLKIIQNFLVEEELLLLNNKLIYYENKEKLEKRYLSLSDNIKEIFKYILLNSSTSSIPHDFNKQSSKYYINQSYSLMNFVDFTSFPSSPLKYSLDLFVNEETSHVSSSRNSLLALLLSLIQPDEDNFVFKLIKINGEESDSFFYSLLTYLKNYNIKYEQYLSSSIFSFSDLFNEEIFLSHSFIYELILYLLLTKREGETKNENIEIEEDSHLFFTTLVEKNFFLDELKKYINLVSYFTSNISIKKNQKFFNLYKNFFNSFQFFIKILTIFIQKSSLFSNSLLYTNQLNEILSLLYFNSTSENNKKTFFEEISSFFLLFLNNSLIKSLTIPSNYEEILIQSTILVNTLHVGTIFKNNLYDVRNSSTYSSLTFNSSSLNNYYTEYTLIDENLFFSYAINKEEIENLKQIISIRNENSLLLALSSLYHLSLNEFSDNISVYFYQELTNLSNVEKENDIDTAKNKLVSFLTSSYFKYITSYQQLLLNYSHLLSNEVLHATSFTFFNQILLLLHTFNDIPLDNSSLYTPLFTILLHYLSLSSSSSINYLLEEELYNEKMINNCQKDNQNMINNQLIVSKLSVFSSKTELLNQKYKLFFDFYTSYHTKSSNFSLGYKEFSLLLMLYLLNFQPISLNLLNNLLKLLKNYHSSLISLLISYYPLDNSLDNNIKYENDEENKEKEFNQRLSLLLLIDLFSLEEFLSSPITSSSTTSVALKRHQEDMIKSLDVCHYLERLAQKLIKNQDNFIKYNEVFYFFKFFSSLSVLSKELFHKGFQFTNLKYGISHEITEESLSEINEENNNKRKQLNDYEYRNVKRNKTESENNGEMEIEKREEISIIEFLARLDFTSFYNEFILLFEKNIVTNEENKQENLNLFYNTLKSYQLLSDIFSNFINPTSPLSSSTSSISHYYTLLIIKNFYSLNKFFIKNIITSFNQFIIINSFLNINNNNEIINIDNIVNNEEKIFYSFLFMLNSFFNLSNFILKLFSLLKFEEFSSYCVKDFYLFFDFNSSSFTSSSSSSEVFYNEIIENSLFTLLNFIDNNLNKILIDKEIEDNNDIKLKNILITSLNFIEAVTYYFYQLSLPYNFSSSTSNSALRTTFVHYRHSSTKFHHFLPSSSVQISSLNSHLAFLPSSTTTTTSSPSTSPLPNLSSSSKSDSSSIYFTFLTYSTNFEKLDQLFQRVIHLLDELSNNPSFTSLFSSNLHSFSLKQSILISENIFSTINSLIDAYNSLPSTKNNNSSTALSLVPIKDSHKYNVRYSYKSQ